MRITVLGTAAAEGIPAIFCVCDVCKTARERGGREIRRRTAYLIDDAVMVDFGPDSYNSMISFGLDYSGVQHLLVSHSHQDHFALDDLYYRRPGFSVVAEGSLLTVWGNEAVVRRLCERYSAEELERMTVAWREVKAFEEVDLGRYRAVPVRANHGGDAEDAFNWLVEGDGGRVLFGNDTGWWPAETWDFLAGKELDVVFIDSTSGRIPNRDHHMGCEIVAQARDMLWKIGAMAENGRVIAIHFSHNGGMLHDELEEFYGPRGVEVAYDGMVVEVGER